MDSKGTGVLNSFIGALTGAVVDVGRAGLHVLGPENFEYYMCSLSLRDRSGVEVAYMSFPVMPNNIMESQMANASVTKTNKGVVTQFNSSFNLKEISIQGTFGRKLRLILGNKEFVSAETGFQMAQKFFNGNVLVNADIAGTDILIKTGYGMMKMMQRILDAAYQNDDNGPYIIVFTNYAFNTSYVVEPLQRSFSQSTENNMLWYYNIEMKAVADAGGLTLDDTKSVGKFLGQVAANAVSNVLTDVISQSMRLIAL